MAKVDVPVVPCVRAASYDSMDSMRNLQVDSFNNSALDITSVRQNTVWQGSKAVPFNELQTLKTTNLASKYTTQLHSLQASLLTQSLPQKKLPLQLSELTQEQHHPSQLLYYDIFTIA